MKLHWNDAWVLSYQNYLRIDFHFGCVQGDPERYGKTGKSMKRAGLNLQKKECQTEGNGAS